MPALIAGSLSPDLGYGLEALNTDQLSHHLLGSIIFCAPAGLALLLMFWAVPGARLRSLGMLPSPLRSPASLVVILVSIWIGACSHFVWDSFTNKNGWFVHCLPVLKMGLGTVAGHRVLVCHILWYLSSFAGVCSICFALEKWNLREVDAPSLSVTRNAHLRNGIVGGVLVLPIGVVHHLVHGMLGQLLVALLSAGLVSAALFLHVHGSSRRLQ